MAENSNHVLFEVVLNGVRIAPPQTSDVILENFSLDRFQSFFTQATKNFVKKVIPEYTNEQLAIELSKVEVEQFSVEVGADASYIINLTVFDPSMAAIDFIVNGTPQSEQYLEVVLGWMGTEEKIVVKGTLLTGIEPSIVAGGVRYNLSYILDFNERLMGVSESVLPLYKVYDRGKFKLRTPERDASAWRGYETLVWDESGVAKTYVGRHILFKDLKFKTGLVWSLIEDVDIVTSAGKKFFSKFYVDNAPEEEKSSPYYTVKLNGKVTRLFHKEFLKSLLTYNRVYTDTEDFHGPECKNLRSKILNLYKAGDVVYPDTKLNDSYQIYTGNSVEAGMRIMSVPLQWTEKSADVPIGKTLPDNAMNVFHLILTLAGLNNIDVRIDPVLLGGVDDPDFSVAQSFIASKVMPLQYNRVRDIADSGSRDKIFKTVAEVDIILETPSSRTPLDAGYPLGRCGSIKDFKNAKGEVVRAAGVYTPIDEPRQGLYRVSKGIGALPGSDIRVADVEQHSRFFRGLMTEKIEAFWLYMIEFELKRKSSDLTLRESIQKSEDICRVLHWEAAEKSPRYGNKIPCTLPGRGGFVCQKYLPFEGVLYSAYSSEYNTYLNISRDKSRPKSEFQVGKPISAVQQANEKMEDLLLRLIKEYGYYYPNGLKDLDKVDPLKLYGYFNADPSTGNIVLNITGEVQHVLMDNSRIFEFPRQTVDGRVLDFRVDAEGAYFLPMGQDVKSAVKPVVSLNLGIERVSAVSSPVGTDLVESTQDWYTDWVTASAFYTAPQSRGNFDIAIASQRVVDLHNRIALLASLTLVGSPDLALMENIQVNVIRPNGTLHYLSGVYKILHIAHEFRGATYQTVLTIIRGIKKTADGERELEKNRVFVSREL